METLGGNSLILQREIPFVSLMTRTVGWQVDLVVISGRTNKVIARVGVGLLPEGVGVNPRTNRIYVGNALSGSVSVVSGRTRKVVATVGVEPGPDTRIAVIRGPTPFTALWVAAGCG